MPYRRACSWLVFLGAAALALGCGSPKFHVVRGKVLWAETQKPLTEGEVRFQPVSRPGLVATGKIQPNGKFTLATPGHGDGVLEGQCRAAVVVPPRDGKPVIHERYQEFDTADLLFTVTERQENHFTLEVSRARR